MKCYRCNKEIKKNEPKKTIRVKKRIKEKGSRKYLCLFCNSRKCKRCTILLSNEFISRSGKQNGLYYKEHPQYCRDCWDVIKKGGDKNAQKK